MDKSRESTEALERIRTFYLDAEVHRRDGKFTITATKFRNKSGEIWTHRYKIGSNPSYFACLNQALSLVSEIERPMDGTHKDKKD